VFTSGKLKNKIAPYLFTLPAAVVLMMLMVLPILYAFNLSFLRYRMDMPTSTVKFIGLENYHRIFKSQEFISSLSWTLVFTVIVVSLELVLGMIIAQLLNSKLLKKSSMVFRTILFIPMMVSPIVVGVIWRMIFEAKFGILNYLLSLASLHGVNWLGAEIPAKAALIITEVWHNTPFVMLVLLAALQTVPNEIYDAALVDGSSAMTTFFRITLPHIRNFIALVVSIRLMDALRYFDEIFTLTNGGPGTSTQTTGYMIYQMVFRYSEVGLGAAGAFIFLVLIFMISMISLGVLRRESSVDLG
jgi:multiple sugar transport system permease protein